jgi:hypothetical protein
VLCLLQLISREEAKRVSVVEYDVGNVNSIAQSIGNAGKIVLALGSTENGPKARLTAQDGLRVLEAAQLANSSHFVLISSKGGSSGGGGGFFGNLFGGGGAVNDKGLVDKIAKSGLTYTVVRAAADGESEGNLVVAAEGAALGGKVSAARPLWGTPESAGTMWVTERQERAGDGMLRRGMMGE